jgi:hypothetical protein
MILTAVARELPSPALQSATSGFWQKTRYSKPTWLEGEAMKATRIFGTLAGLGLAVLAFAPSKAQAQVSASISADAVVQIALTASAGDNLNFGSVFPGTTRNILPSDPSSGSFQLVGSANAEVSVTFDLSGAQNLSNGVDNLPVSFNSTAAAHNSSNSRAGATVFDPNVSLTRRLDATTGELWLFIGGSVSPTTQPAGAYSGTIVLNAAYTGN